MRSPYSISLRPPLPEADSSRCSLRALLPCRALSHSLECQKPPTGSSTGLFRPGDGEHVAVCTLSMEKQPNLGKTCVLAAAPPSPPEYDHQD